jgi:hypothetical protein
MAYSYDFFVAELECPVCGTISAADDSIEMYTYIRDQPKAEYLGVGSPLYIEAQAIEQNACDGYLKVRTPQPHEPIFLLNPWRCVTCGAYNWAQIENRDGVIASITGVPLNRETLERSHLISNEADFIAADLMNISASEIVEKDTVRILWERL